MRLKDWLQEHGKTQRWLARQLGVSEGAVSQRLTAQERSGRPLPTSWISRVISITDGAVGLDDEWPVQIDEGEDHEQTADRAAV